MSVELHTYADAIASLDRWVGFSSDRPSMNQAGLRSCIQGAYRAITQAHDWSFLHVPGRIQLNEVYETGTAAYDHTGGTSERLVTIAGGTVPSWANSAKDAVIKIGDVVCEIEDRKSSTTFTLDATLNPGADVAATTYQLYQRWYAMPGDLVSFTAPLEDTAWKLGKYVSMTEMAALQRYRSDSGDIQYYSVGPAPGLYNQLALFVHPASNATETLDFIYKRRPRPLRYSGLDNDDYVGTVNLTGLVITGTSTQFASGMEGAILRVHLTARPTGLEGTAPWVNQCSIKTVASTTSITLYNAGFTNGVAYKYQISDPIDFDVAVWDAFLRCCEKHAANLLGLKDRREVGRLAEEALFDAKGGDARIKQRRIAGAPQTVISRLSDSPIANRPEGTAL